MPVEQVYQPQVAPAGAVPLPDASPASFGAGVGAAIAGVGDAAHEADLRAYHIQREQQTDQQAADFNAKFAAARLAADKTSADARVAAPLGGAGHADAMAQYWQSQSQDLLSGITDDKLRRSAGQQLNEFGTRFQSAEYQWQQGAQIGKATVDQTKVTDAASNRVYTMHDPQAYAEEMSLGRQSIENMTNVPADIREKLAQQHDQRVTEAFARGVIDTNPAGAKTVLDSGAFDQILEPQQLEQLRRQADTAQRRQTAIAAHQDAIAKSAANDQIATVKAQVAAGIQVTPQDMAAAEQNAASLGKDATVVELRAIHVGNDLNQVSQAWTPEEWSTNINALAAKGKDRTPDEDIALQHLQQRAPDAIRQFRNDPYGWAATTGIAVAPLNPHDPASVAARQQAQARISGVTNLPTPFLQPQEVASYKAELASGPQGKLAVANEIGGFGGRTAYTAAKQIAPDDTTLSRLVLLQPTARAAAMEGADARKANQGLVDGPSPAGQPGTGTKIVTQAAFAQHVAPAAMLLDQHEVASVLDIARNIYADTATKNGVLSFNQNLFNTSIHRALGGTRDPQGNWYGGVGTSNGAPVLLPPTMTQQSFDTTLTRMGWHPDWKDAPTYAGGGPAMTAADVRKFVPVQRPDGTYEFHSPTNGAKGIVAGGTVLHKRDGSIWTMDVAGLAKKMGL